ncbi:MAG: crossover junction endodeoxyribonuclease RuvC [Alphaproteobacteria bacterium]|nr:MAG: crossover junction endodeoxyribonuclease RuvC [Alphaproteobacteria bacterium]
MSALPLRILGIDPGLQHTGWGIIQAHGSRRDYIACGAIHPPPALPLSERLHYLHQHVHEVIAHYRPDETALEQTFINNNAASSLKLGNARGALMLSLAIAGLSVHEYDATRIKKTLTGNGRASKEQIRHMINIVLPHVHSTHTHDAYDALAVAFTHAQWRGNI